MIEIPDEDIEFSFFRSSGPGGQKKNVTDSAVRLHHIPTGIVVVSTQSRSQFRNKQMALQELKKRLEQLSRRKKPRIPTRARPGAKRKRLEKKKQRGQLKQMRKPPKLDD